MIQAGRPTLRHAGYRRLTFTFGEVRFACEIDESLHERQGRHLLSYLDLDSTATTGPAGDPDAAVRITVSDAAFHRLLPPGPPDGIHTAFVGVPYDLWEDGGTTVYRYPATFPCTGPLGEHLFAVSDDEIQVVARESAPEPERLLRHLIYDVLRSTWEDRGAAMFHAACAATDNVAVLVVGRKGAGKTTTVTMLGSGGLLHLCSNDRTLVVGAGDAVLGLPLAYRLGHGQVHSEPALAALLDCVRSRTDGAAPCDPARKHVVTPALLAEALGTRIGQGGKLGLILLPWLSPDDRPFWHRPVGPAEVADELIASCYTPHDPVFREPRFRRRCAPEAVRAATADATCRRLADGVPAARVGWGVQADLATVRRELHRLVLGWSG